MCGIVLAVLSEQATGKQLRLARHDIHASLRAMDARGGDAWGIGYSCDSSLLTTTHGLGEYSSQPECRIPHLAPGSMLVGHTRMATRGAVTLQNAHPFRHLAGAWAHNGSYDFPHASEGPHETVDSYYLTAQIAAASNEWKDRALAHGGYGTVVGIDPDTMSAYLWQSGGAHEVYQMTWGMLIVSSPVKPGVDYGRKLPSVSRETLHMVTPSECVSTDVKVTLHERDASEWFKNWRPRTRTGQFAALASNQALADACEVAGWSKCLMCDTMYQPGDDYLCPRCHGWEPPAKLSEGHE